MRVSVIGCGYLGAVHAACMARLGHDVIGIDVDERKIVELSSARAPFYEPGLEELLEDVQQTGRLSFTTDMSAAAGSDVHFICVGTPQKKGENAADLTYVKSAPFSPFFCGVPTHIKWTWLPAAAAISVVKARRPVSCTSRRSSSRPGS